MKPVLIIQNSADEGPGQLGSILSQRGVQTASVLGSFANLTLLRPDAFSALVVLGGAQAAYETEQHPYLQDELAVCKRFIEAQKPVAGFCLGAQLLARALGGEVVPGNQKEIGWYELTLEGESDDDALMWDQPRKLLSYHFHGDIIKKAPGCINLASSAMTECQLFRYGSSVYGFQYHAEVDAKLLEEMCLTNEAYLSANGINSRRIIEEARIHLPSFESSCRVVLNRWVDLFAS